MILYSFRTAPFKETLLEMQAQTFIFGRLKEDFALLSERMLKENPEFIVGIAHSEDETRFEARAINQFNGTKKVAQEGPQYVDLHVPQQAIFKSSDKPSDSFCNWTAYKLTKFAKDKKLRTKVVFAHVNHKDIDAFLDSLTKIE
jgi:hypothetical protein